VTNGNPGSEGKAGNGKPLARVETRIGVRKVFLCVGDCKPSLGDTDPTKLFGDYDIVEMERIKRRLNRAALSWAGEREKGLVVALELALTYMRPSVELTHFMDGFMKRRTVADDDLEAIEKVLSSHRLTKDD
jgi:hypothetical protein